MIDKSSTRYIKKNILRGSIVGLVLSGVFLGSMLLIVVFELSEPHLFGKESPTLRGYYAVYTGFAAAFLSFILGMSSIVQIAVLSFRRSGERGVISELKLPIVITMVSIVVFVSGAAVFFGTR